MSEAVALLAYAHFGGLLMQWPLGLISDVVGRRAVMATGLIVASAIAIIISMQTTSAGNLIFWLVFIWGGSALSIYSIALSHAIDHFEGDNLVSICATMLVTWSTASVMGPVLAGLVMESFGPTAMFSFSATCQALAGLFIIARMLNTKRRKSKKGFVNVPISSGLLHSLDPRRK